MTGVVGGLVAYLFPPTDTLTVCNMEWPWKEGVGVAVMVVVMVTRGCDGAGAHMAGPLFGLLSSCG